MQDSTSRPEASATMMLETPPDRFDFLDALRGIAALAVFVAHAGVCLSPRFAHVSFTWFEPGHFGVILFFLCSGFIIPVSLERQGSLKRFWIRRISRLYPLYWCSIGGVVLLDWWSGVFPAQISQHFGEVVVANLTMLQTLFGYPNMMILYWTLFYEMIFYILISLLFACRVLNQYVVINSWLLIVALVCQIVLPITIGLSFPIILVTYPAIMYFGTLCYHGYQGNVSRRAILCSSVLMIAVLIVSPFHSDQQIGQGWAAFHLFTARLAAFAVFGGVLLLRLRRIPRILLYLGQISYSLYLVHPFVLSLVPRVANPGIALLLWFVVLIVAASVTYRYIERPGIAWGRKLTRSIKQTIEATQTVTATTL